MKEKSIYNTKFVLFNHLSKHLRNQIMSAFTSDTAASGDLGFDGFPVSLNYFTAVPDATFLSDPNVAIIFKSLLKKDSITKEKSLNDLNSYISEINNKSVFEDDLVIISWVQLYPKLAIDNSRNVRILSHKIHSLYLEIIGGKAFSKYLKSSMPIWLQGIYDNDKTVANSTYKYLLNSFQNDKEKVDTKIWIIFLEPIVNYITSVITSETHESLSDQRYIKEVDSQAKYERVLNGGLMMLIKIIQLMNSNDLKDYESVIFQIELIINLEKLWDYFGKSIEHQDTMNLPLFKTYLILLKTIFSVSNETNEPSALLKSLSNVKSLYKLISKKFIKSIKLKPTNKSTNGGLIYSNVILQFWDTLISLTKFSAISKDFKVKKNFWELGGSKSYSRLIDYLKLGNCALSPIYYKVLRTFFTKLSESKISSDDDFKFLDFSDIGDAKIILKVLASQLDSLSNFDYKLQLISCLLQVYSLFEKGVNDAGRASLLDMLSSTIYKVEDSLAQKAFRNSDKDAKYEAIKLTGQFLGNESKTFILKGLNKMITNFATSETSTSLTIGDFEFTSSIASLLEVHLNILLEVTTHDDASDNDFSSQLVTGIIESLQDNSALSAPTTAFEILLNIIGSKASLSIEARNSLKEFSDLLPSFIESDFIEAPINLLSVILKAQILDNTKDLVDDFYTKIESESKGYLSTYVLHLKSNDFLDFATIQSTYPYIYSYLVELSKKKTSTDIESQLIFNFANDSEIFANLVKSSPSDAPSSHNFIKHFIKFSSTISIIANDQETQNSLREIYSTAWARLEITENRDFIALSKTPATLHLLIDSLFDYITLSSKETDFTHISKFVSLSFELFPLHKLENRVELAIDNVNTTLLSIANPLEQNIYLIPTDAESTCGLDESIIFIGKFLESFLSIHESIELSDERSSILQLSELVSEYLTDYSFLASEKKNVDQVISISSSLSDHVNRFLIGVDLSSLVKVINENFTEESEKLQLKFAGHLNNEISVKENFTKRQFYNSRLFRKVILRSSGNISLQQFETLDINFNNLVSYPLKLAAVLSGFARFATKSKKFDRIRNLCAAEILGVKSDSQILSQGLRWLTLSINFLNVDLDDAEDYEAIPPQRLGMILNQLSKWMESDMSYDDSFIVIRIQLSRFFAGLIRLNADSLPEKFWDLSQSLCTDNLSTSQIEFKRLDLRYFTLKLFVGLNKNLGSREGSSDWEEFKTSSIEEIIDLVTNEEVSSSDIKLHNQPVYLSNDLVGRILLDIPFKDSIIQDKIDQFYYLLRNVKFVSLQRLGATFLQKSILRTQQEYVVEYQLAKSKLSEEDGTFEAKIPPIILDIIENFEGDVEDLINAGESHQVSAFLWSWLLVFAHFKDITYSIRNEYINQLKSSGVIDKLLDNIFQQVDVTNSKILKAFTSSDSAKGNTKIHPNDNLINTYELANGCAGESFVFEMRFLLVHLYYLSFQHLGSQVQFWFNSIRDKQLKQQIEKFSVNYVSPLIVTKILEEVSSSKDKLTGKEENLTIKVNYVSNEVKSIYLIDEQTMEMIIKIPHSYPLSNVTVEGPLRLGVKESQWKAWLLASQRIISLTNGSIIEAVELFNKNVNLNFSGFEDCAICYSILHQDHSLPSKVCPTCLNKFHSACLYKWFKSSGASTCPLCRSPFNFRNSRNAATA